MPRDPYNIYPYPVVGDFDYIARMDDAQVYAKVAGTEGYRAPVSVPSSIYPHPFRCVYPCTLFTLANIVPLGGR